MNKVAHYNGFVGRCQQYGLTKQAADMLYKRAAEEAAVKDATIWSSIKNMWKGLSPEQKGALLGSGAGGITGLLGGLITGHGVGRSALLSLLGAGAGGALGYGAGYLKSNINRNRQGIDTTRRDIDTHGQHIARNGLQIARNRRDIDTHGQHITRNGLQIARNRQDIDTNRQGIKYNLEGITHTRAYYRKLIEYLNAIRKQNNFREEEHALISEMLPLINR